MNEHLFKASLIFFGSIFFIFFSVVVFPPILADWDIIGAFAAGFVNPFASGYSMDVIICWCILAVWVLHEKHMHQLKYGYRCLVLGIVPGVAVGFALYLFLRNKQLKEIQQAPAPRP